MNDPISGGRQKSPIQQTMVRAQNDLYMVVTNSGSEENEYEDDTLEALKEGRLTVGELQRCAMNICHFILHTSLPKKKIKNPGRDGSRSRRLFFYSCKTLSQEAGNNEVDY